MAQAEPDDAAPRGLPAGGQNRGRTPPVPFRHLRLIHPARNRLPRDFIS